MAEQRLLVVDDVPEFCDFVAQVATDMGITTEKLSDPRQFKDVFARFQPDTLVLDMVMPELDGFEIIKWLIEERCQVKLLIVTGHNPLYAKSAQLQSAAKGLAEVKTFTKPVSVSKLRAALA